MAKEIRGITFFSVFLDSLIFGGFICVNEFAIKNLVQAYEWFFYFTTVLGAIALFVPELPARWQYTKAKYHFEILTNTLLGIMLAYYGYFVCATILTFFGYVLSQKCYFKKEDSNEQI
ncbi:hypothetical protein A6046_05185 [[Haemophilus] ducreyi]|uniref:Uncharacterized protein n=2 Tax=Haemophilus ducreyi TaxID=730 RepID=Q7VNK7_HAEDU|nr:hypothetical protein [[Haemophilus] ducreyi]AAP95452.1 hypothetical protein HD_0502 [[Haemophilus] ducreyi 35000HP]AKO30556.1 hypothetical protein RY60_01980 [[Haemophilus] ducreyi]AKO31993.1 hypothetical protein RZ57_01985 [[Haemophilus] ducreyi]AKO33448.1 hypothetical protein RZ58_01985 [[Haemophilus] ducreyi]AKO34895.1 hypothetical protein RZ59_01970 [[Haemophilus] ducreyi]